MSSDQKGLVERHREVLEVELETGTAFLEALRREGVLDRAAVHRVKGSASDGTGWDVRDRRERNAVVLTDLLSGVTSRPYDILLRALQASHQYVLAASIMEPQVEKMTLIECQAVARAEQRKLASYLDAQIKRRKAKITPETPRDGGDEETEEWNPKDLSSAVETTKGSILQMERCRLLLDKVFDMLSSSAHTSTSLHHQLLELDSAVTKASGATPRRQQQEDEEEEKGEEQAEEGKQPEDEQTLKLKGKDEGNMTLVTRLKKNLNKLIEVAYTSKEEHRKYSKDLMEVVMKIRDRRVNLQRKINNHAPGGKGGTRKVDDSEPKIKEADSLETRISQLRTELTRYVEAEIQATHRLTVSTMQRKFQARTLMAGEDGLVAAERALDGLDAQEHAQVQAAVKSSLQDVKTERQESTKLIEDMKKAISTRKDVLNASGNASPQVRRRNPSPARGPPGARGLPGKKGSAPSSAASTPASESLAGKLTLLQEDLNAYVQLETNSTQKFRSEMSKSRSVSDKRYQDQDQYAKKLNDDLEATRAEKEKYKKLYEQEKVFKGRQVIARDTQDTIRSLEKKLKEAELERDKMKRQSEQLRVSRKVPVAVKDGSVRSMEVKVKSLETDRDKYKRLYEQYRSGKRGGPGPSEPSSKTTSPRHGKEEQPRGPSREQEGSTVSAQEGHRNGSAKANGTTE